jgi:hypothetical protein
VQDKEGEGEGGGRGRREEVAERGGGVLRVLEGFKERLLELRKRGWSSRGGVGCSLAGSGSRPSEEERAVCGVQCGCAAWSVGAAGCGLQGAGCVEEAGGRGGK